MCLRGRVDAVQDLCGDGEAGPGAPHCKEQVIAPVDPELGDGLVLVLGVQRGVTRGQVHDGAISCHHPHPDYVLSAEYRDRNEYEYERKRTFSSR